MDKHTSRLGVKDPQKTAAGCALYRRPLENCDFLRMEVQRGGAGFLKIFWGMHEEADVGEFSYKDSQGEVYFNKAAGIVFARLTLDEDEHEIGQVGPQGG